MFLNNNNGQQLPSQKNQYICMICYSWYQKPISCSRCHIRICKQHMWGLRNRCPTCRLQPFQYLQQKDLDRQIQRQVFKIRDDMKKVKIFNCLVEGCNYSGKYSQMVIHKKSRHYYQKIDDILFPEQRQKKLKKDSLMKNFFGMIMQRVKNYKQKALEIYIKTRGIFQIQQISKMVGHADQCENQRCKEVLFDQISIFIGVKDENGGVTKSECEKAVMLMQWA